MTAIFGEGYFCSCDERDKCDDFCPVYRARENEKYGNAMIQITEAEFEKMKKAQLIVMSLNGIMRMIEEN